MRWVEVWTKAQAWRCPCHPKKYPRVKSIKDWGCPRGTPSSSAKIRSPINTLYFYCFMHYAFFLEPLYFRFQFYFVLFATIIIGPQQISFGEDALRFYLPRTLYFCCVQVPCCCWWRSSHVNYAPVFFGAAVWSVAKLGSITFWSLAFSYWFDKPWFHNWGKLAAVLLMPSSWGSQLGALTPHHQYPSPFFYIYITIYCKHCLLSANIILRHRKRTSFYTLYV
jgi:hypothetical protein